MPYLILTALALIVAATFFYRHQRLLKERAQLMRDAIRHRDFSFHLPTRGLFFGEKALQEALNDLGSETQRLLARGEVESWQKLTRVLTHEIMNAAAPIQSISQAYLSSPDIEGSPFEEGIRAIHDTSSDLTSFIDNYRKLTQLQEPVITDINVLSFAESLASLYPQLQWRIDIPADLRIKADESLLRQVFINLVKNAIEAEAKGISLTPAPSPRRGESFANLAAPLLPSPRRGVGGEAVGGGFISFSNDGHAIPPSVAQEIFVPFFSTKQRGTGIGLSLSRQILMMMGMTLRLADSPQDGYNVTFVIETN